MKRNKGFTLLELVIVIIILGILATLGFAQFTRMIERSRGAEARQVIGTIRTQLAALWMETANIAGADDATVGIGNVAGQISGSCAGGGPASQYFFEYELPVAGCGGADTCTITARRCTAGGKNPQGPAATDLILTVDFLAGTDVWSGSGGY